MNAFVTRLHGATLLLHAVLTASLFAWIASRGTLPHLALAVIAVLPLLAAWRGLKARRAYTAGWACMVVSFYCALLLAEAYMQPSLRAGLIAFGLIAAFDFVALMLFAKAQKQLDRISAASRR